MNNVAGIHPTKSQPGRARHTGHNKVAFPVCWGNELDVLFEFTVTWPLLVNDDTVAVGKNRWVPSLEFQLVRWLRAFSLDSLLVFDLEEGRNVVQTGLAKRGRCRIGDRCRREFRRRQRT